MRYVAAYLLAAMGTSKHAPTSEDVEKILSSVGIEAEASLVKKVVGELKDKNIEELMAEGAKRLASMPAGGAPAAGGGGADAPAADGGSAPAADAKKEEKKEESDASDDDMGFGLFD